MAAPALTNRAPAADLPADLAALIPHDAPELVAAGWVSEHLGISNQAVNAAIRAGRIPSTAVHGVNGTVIAHAIRPHDAVVLWGRRALTVRAKAERDETQP